MGQRGPLYLEKWTPWFASLVVLIFSLTLVRVCHWQAKRYAAAVARVRALEAERASEVGGEEEEGEGEEGGVWRGKGPAGWGAGSEAGGGVSSAGSKALASLGSAILSIVRYDVRAPLKGQTDFFFSSSSAILVPCPRGFRPSFVPLHPALTASASDSLGLECGPHCSRIWNTVTMSLYSQHFLPPFLLLLLSVAGSLGLLQIVLGSNLDPLQQDMVHTVQASTGGLVHQLSTALDAWFLHLKDLGVIGAPTPPAHPQTPLKEGTGTPQQVSESGQPGGPGSGSGSANLGKGGPGLELGLGLGTPDPLHLDKAVFELRSVVDEVLAMCGGEACEKALEIASLVLDSVPAAVVGDPLRLRQVLLSLLLASVKLTERGHVFLCVRLAPDETDLPSLSKRVSDLGKAPPGTPGASAPQGADSGGNGGHGRGYQPSGARGPEGLEEGSEGGAEGDAELGAAGDDVSEAGEFVWSGHSFLFFPPFLAELILWCVGRNLACGIGLID